LLFGSNIGSLVIRREALLLFREWGLSLKEGGPLRIQESFLYYALSTPAPIRNISIGNKQSPPAIKTGGLSRFLFRYFYCLNHFLLKQVVAEKYWHDKDLEKLRTKVTQVTAPLLPISIL
jgi:hypothetical protein